MAKWIFGIIGTVIAGLLLAYATNVLNLDGGGGDKTAGASIPTSDPPPTPPKKGRPRPHAGDDAPALPPTRLELIAVPHL